LKASEQGHAPAWRYLGQCYEQGLGVEKNLDEAKKWYAKAKEKGDSFSRARLNLLNKE